MTDLGELFARLATSRFRPPQKLSANEFTPEEQRHVLAALERWLRSQSVQDGLVG